MEQKVIQPIALNYQKFRKEFCRLSKMSTFARAMDRAIDTKADAWLAYTPLSTDQLFDTVDHRDFITIIIPFGGNLCHARSTYRGAAFYAQRTVWARPTHTLGILHALGMFVLDSDFVVVRQEPNKQLRWCVICRTTHNVSEFAQNKRYLNGLAFACKRAQAEKASFVWRKVA